MIRSSEDEELWTTARAAEHCGVSASTYRDYIRTLGAPGAISRQPGRAGQNLHSAAAVREWQAARVGQGARTDLRTAR